MTRLASFIHPAFWLLVLLTPPAFAQCRVLVLGDSNTWGSNASGPRHGEDVRWPGILGDALPNALVLEEGKIGRRSDLGSGAPLDHFGGQSTVPMPKIVARHMPLDLAIIMLGTNDLQRGLQRSAEVIAVSVFSLAIILKFNGVEQVLVVTPPPLREPERGQLDYLFGGAEEKSHRLYDSFLPLSEETSIPLFEAGSVVYADGEDGVHMTAASHNRLGLALAPVASKLLQNCTH